jgi:hypothetical protein
MAFELHASSHVERPVTRALAGLLSLLALVVLAVASAERAPLAASSGANAEDSGCVSCHEGIEPMHPQAELSCVDCHGGDGASRNKLEAHAKPPPGNGKDERVADPDADLSWRRFRNPMDLRVAKLACGPCHEEQVRNVHTSLHATTAGHLSDGYYEMGLAPQKGSTFSVFNVPAHLAKAGDVKELVQVPPFRESGPREQIATHFADLARKECMQCHLWSEGRAVRGRVGFDGDYRGEGCAACHVPYARDGLSESTDRSAKRAEPGHPRVHAMTRAPTTDTCTSCHYGDASIGLNFRGLSQLPPGAPGGPEIPGTTDALLNRQFYLDDPALCPPDIHHEKGMHCIDCHTQNDVMGDGTLYGAMEQAVEISCVDCHGDFERPATLRTARGTPLTHLSRTGDKVVLRSKVDGREHAVTQVAHVLDPKRPEYNAEAARAMNKSHGKLECYLCHSNWNPNFLGFHFDRNESLTQLDLLSGAKSKGRVTTQEKVFATWKSFYAGLNEAGRFAPYLTGFSTMGTARDAEGRVLVDQGLPVTSAGLSGMTMIHHQMHTVRAGARSCVECHRSSSTWGLGSENFRLARQRAFVADRRGIEILALERANLAASTPISKFVLPDIVALELDSDPLQGRASTLYAAEGHRGIHVLDASDNAELQRLQFVATVQPKAVKLVGEHLYIADGVGGLRIFRVEKDRKLAQLAILPTFDARDLAIHWPYAYIADGPGGVLIVDIRNPAAPKAVGGVRASDADGKQDEISHVETLFQYSRPRVDEEGELQRRRTPARLLLAALDENEGLFLFDATEASAPQRLFPALDGATRARRVRISWRGLHLASHVDLAEPQGGAKTREADYVYALGETSDAGGNARSRLMVYDVSEPRRAKVVANVEAGYATEMLASGSFYNTPFLQTILFTPGELGVTIMDASVSAAPKQIGALPSILTAYVVAVEEFPLDKMLDEADRPLKDVSHVNSRWLRLREIERLLLVPGELLGTLGGERTPGSIPAQTARLHFANLDADASGMLEGAELASAGVSPEFSGDGRVFLSELAGLAGLTAAPTTEAERAPGGAVLRTRVDLEGDLSRLLDGLKAAQFDANRDRKLDRAELSRAFFAALDLDGNEALDVHELSRHPGELRQLRYGGAWAKAKFAELDANRNGTLQVREFAVDARDLEALDRSGDGFVQLDPPGNRFLELRGILGPASEWPTRRAFYSPLPPTITAEDLVARFDTDRDGKLTQRELKKRGDLFTDLDANGDSVIAPNEVQLRVAQLVATGIDASPDRFVERWDLDGDGKVAPEELPPSARILLAR